MERRWMAAFGLVVLLALGAILPGQRAFANETFAYGLDPRQAVDFYPAPASADDVEAKPPLILFVHGGGWQIGHRMRVQQKPDFFNGLGYAFASVGYRLVPDVTVEEQAGDIGRAIASLRRLSDQLDFDGDRIVLVGHSAGAHLAALVATDPRYLGADMEAIAGVILLDGAGYDVPAQMAHRGGLLWFALIGRMYRQAFGENPERQRALSPVTHVGAPDAPDWLILHVARRTRSGEQSRALAERLEAAGASAEVHAIADTNHGRLNRELGEPGDQASAIVADYLAGLFGR